MTNAYAGRAMKEIDGEAVIDPASEVDLRYWTHRLRVTQDELLRAFEAAGPFADSVKDYLQQQE